jgi:hypothetical protein
MHNTTNFVVPTCYNDFAQVLRHLVLAERLILYAKDCVFG